MQIKYVKTCTLKINNIFKFKKYPICNSPNLISFVINPITITIYKIFN